MVAMKMYLDIEVNLAVFSKLTHLTKLELASGEINLLTLLDYNLVVSSDELEAYLKTLGLSLY